MNGLWWIVCFISFLLAAHAPGQTLHRGEFTQLLMGVQARVVIYAPNAESAEAGARAAFDRISALEAVMSDYREDSELSRLSGYTGPVQISDDLWTVLKQAKSIAKTTGGAFDPALGAMSRLWRESRSMSRLPETAAIEAARKVSGHALVEVSHSTPAVSLAVQGVRFDLGGIGKGFAAQEAVRVLKQRGLDRCLVSLAGDIATGDPPPDAPGWRINVETGYDSGAATIHLANASCSTSGDAEQFVEINGKRYSHILDPATGLGSIRSAAACVVAPDGATADALATAMSILGAEKGRQVLNAFPHAAALIFERAGGRIERFVSESFPLANAMFDPGNEPPPGFVALFTGRDLSGWQGLAGSPPDLSAMSLDRRSRAQSRADQRMREHWKVEEGVLKFDGKGDSLQTARPFRDFELYVDWSIDKGGDSGIYLRGTPQVQIWDNPVGSGGLYNNQSGLSRPLAIADRAPGKWNRFHIIMKGDRVTVYLNGHLVVDQVQMENYWRPGAPLEAMGPIELQAHGNPLRFKNIFIREIHEPTPPTPEDQRMSWWRHARFGMFIHWGLYAIPAGEWKDTVYQIPSEWLMHHARIPPAEYEKLAPRFNPVKFDANAWADLAREAGMKYIVITTKHHDGFCLFDSAHTDYDIMDASPFKRDIMKELSEAVRDKNMKMCWYHSIMDWHHPDATLERWDRYAPVLRKQVEEILTKYGPIGVMWFDGEWEKEWDTEQGKAMYEMCRRLQPDIIINNRVGKGRQGMQGLTKEGDHPGDFGTPEQEVPARGLPGVDWETCMTMNDSWGFHRTDDQWKSARTLIQMLAETASKGGNFLLNIGPTELGEIPQPSVERLKAMGAWMRINSSSIYGTQAGPFTRLPWGRCTMKDGPSGSILYLHVFEWPESGSLQVPGLLNEVKRAYALSSPAKQLQTSTDAQGVAVKVPGPAPDDHDSVIVLEVIGHAAAVETPLAQSPDGFILLEARDAIITGEGARYEAAESRRCIAYWTGEDVVSWAFRVDTPGRFSIDLELSCQDDAAGSKVAIESGQSSAEMVVEGTGGWRSFKSQRAGEIELGGGMNTLRVVPKKLAKDAVMKLRSIRLAPAGRAE